MLETIEVAERDDNLVCQDTGNVIYWIEAGEDSPLNLARITAGGDARAPSGPRSSIRCARTRSTRCLASTRAPTRGACIPVMHYEFVPGSDVTVHCLPKGSGCENMSFLKMLVPADGVKGIKRFVLDCIVEAAGKPCLPNVCGVGIGGSADLCTTLAKRAMLRPVGGHSDDPLVAALEDELLALGNELGLGPMGLGGRSTLLAVHIEHAHTHITQNPVSVCMECWNARHASATVTPAGEITYGF